MLDPFQRFLGVRADADAMALLGLSPERFDLVRIDAAMREKLEQVFAHPDGRSAEAEQVRQALRAAAEQLKQGVMQRRPGPANKPVRPRGPSAPVFNLTSFDRMALAVMVGSGGWNADSRTRLVALAAAHGVSVQGLVRVMHGLSDYARQGGPQLGVKEIAGGGQLSAINLNASAPGAVTGPPLLDRLTENLSAELKRNDPWPTIKLSVLFGTATLIVGIIALRVIFSHSKSDVVKNNSTADRTGETPFHAPMAALHVPVSSQTDHTRAARFPQKPTFQSSNALPIEALRAVDQCPGLPAQIDELARKLAVADREPSQAVYHNWDESIKLVDSAWVLADNSTRREIDVKVFEALRAAADTPTASDRLLKAFTPPLTVAEPIDLWRGAWRSGMLGKFSGSGADLPPVVVERARALLSAALGQEFREPPIFEAAADLWLDQALPQLVSRLEVDERTYDFWELWIGAQRSLGRGERHDAAIMRAIAAVLATNTDLSRPGRSVNVLGRLVSIMLEKPGATAKQDTLALFDNEKITTRDLWVFTSLMAMSDTATWFADSLVLPEDADQSHRSRVRDDIAQAWPIDAVAMAAVTSPAAGRSLSVDPETSQRWHMVMEAAFVQPLANTPEKQVDQLLFAGKLIEAADALAAQNPTAAQRILDELESQLEISAPATRPSGAGATARHTVRPGPLGATPAPRPVGSPPGGSPPLRTAPKPPSGRPSIRPGQAVGRDGEWAAQYQAAKNNEQRTDILRTLRAVAATDLGPIDAEALVREAYRAAAQDVRSQAQAILAQQFATGPNVAMEMLDQFFDAAPNDGISNMIAAFTGQALSNVRSSSWPTEARLALVKHALALKPDGRVELDDQVEQVIDCYVRRLAWLRREAAPSAAPQSSQEAAQLLVQAWMDQAALAVPTTPVPDDYPGLQRRHAIRLRLAQGPIQQLVAHQLSILDLVTYVTVAEQPALRSNALQLLRDAAQKRSRLGSVLEQAVDIERTIARMWSLRMGLAVKSVGVAS